MKQTLQARARTRHHTQGSDHTCYDGDGGGGGYGDGNGEPWAVQLLQTKWNRITAGSFDNLRKSNLNIRTLLQCLII